MHREQDIGDRAVTVRERISHRKMEPIAHHPTCQRIPVRVETGARQTEQGIARFHAVGAQDSVFIHDTDDAAGQVVIGRRIHTRHFGGFAADQRALIIAATGRDARDDLLGDLGLQSSKRDIIEEEEGLGALHQDVVHAVIDEVLPDRIVTARFYGDFNLGADAIDAGDQQARLVARRYAKQAAESAERAADAWGERRLDETLESPLGIIGGVEIDAGGLVVDHEGISVSKATSLRNSPTRLSTSARVNSMSRSLENFSTANEPSAEPYTTARRMLASLRSPVLARYPTNPPANESPAPVGSKICSNGYAGAKNTDSRVNMNAPCSPFFMITYRGP